MATTLTFPGAVQTPSTQAGEMKSYWCPWGGRDTRALTLSRIIGVLLPVNTTIDTIRVTLKSPGGDTEPD